MTFKNFRISEKLSNLPTLPLGGLTELQGELKDVTTENYHKLKRQIEKRGLILPFFVWYDESTNTNYIEDGHARKKLLVKEGLPLDTQLPVVYIPADNIQDAKEILLAISSQYGTITQEGYDTFTYDLDQAYLEEMVHFDALKVWEEEIANSTGKEVESPEDFGSYDEDIETEYCCPKCGYNWSGKPK